MKIDSKQMQKFCDDAVGKNPDDVEVLCGFMGFRFRTVKIDGVGLMKTNDARFDRVNVEVRNGKIEAAHYG